MITVPEEYAGAVMSDLNTRRGRVQGMGQGGLQGRDQRGGSSAEMQQYATNLRAITQARGLYTMEFVRYDVVPSHLAEQIISQAKIEGRVGENRAAGSVRSGYQTGRSRSAPARLHLSAWRTASMLSAAQRSLKSRL